MGWGTGNLGGGGTSLNFKVVGGTTTPSNPKENTIWVNADVPIPAWVFAAENPYITKSDNLYVVATNPGYIDSNGNIQSNSGWKVTEYIELPDGTQNVTITMSSNTSESPCHAFYDASKNLLSTVYRKPNTNTYDVPVNAKYIRMSERLSESATLIANYIMDDVPKGVVWFHTGTTSPVEFNALKKNAIQVYPMSAKQYVEGVLVDRTAYSYRGGEWTEWWRGQLFSPGNQWESVTGGWEAIGFSSNSAWNAKAPSISMDSTMELTLKAESKNIICSGVAISKKRINLAEANILSVDASSVSLNSASTYKSGAKLCILSTNDITKYLDDITVASAAIRQETSAFTETNIRIELDVSALDGEYFVAIFLGIGSNTSSNCTVKASISDITLEQ